MIDQHTETVREQRRAALNRANEVRTARKEIKEQLAAGALELAELIQNPPGEVDKAEIGDVLEWMPGIGRTRVRKILASSGVSRSVQMRYLSGATRGRIIAQLDVYAPVTVRPRWTG
jgi:hypothetical protein